MLCDRRTGGGPWGWAQGSMCRSCGGFGASPKDWSLQKLDGLLQSKARAAGRWVASVAVWKWRGGLDGSRTELFFCRFGEGKYCVGMVLFCSIRVNQRAVPLSLMNLCSLSQGSSQPGISTHSFHLCALLCHLCPLVFSLKYCRVSASLSLFLPSKEVKLRPVRFNEVCCYRSHRHVKRSGRVLGISGSALLPCLPEKGSR